MTAASASAQAVRQQAAEVAVVASQNVAAELAAEMARREEAERRVSELAVQPREAQASKVAAITEVLDFVSELCLI